jgi:hypothetical protein
MKFWYLKGLSAFSLPILIILSKHLCFTSDVTKLQGFAVCVLSGSFLHQLTQFYTVLYFICVANV